MVLCWPFMLTTLLRAMRMVRNFLLSPMTMQLAMHGSSVLNSFWRSKHQVRNQQDRF